MRRPILVVSRVSRPPAATACVRWPAVSGVPVVVLTRRWGGVGSVPVRRERRRSRAVGRRAASLARADSTGRRKEAGRTDRSGSWVRTRCMIVPSESPVNGSSPVAAYRTTAPQANTSAAGPARSPEMISGAR
ncbi:hypothetical protein GCM10020001_076200 [Nonomuraea salmonea]